MEAVAIPTFMIVLVIGMAGLWSATQSMSSAPKLCIPVNIYAEVGKIDHEA